jgi:hypothetical protein
LEIEIGEVSSARDWASRGVWMWGGGSGRSWGWRESAEVRGGTSTAGAEESGRRVVRERER